MTKWWDFNELPIKVCKSDDMYQFIKESKLYYLYKAFSKIWDVNFTVKYTEFIDSTVSFFVESLAKVNIFWNDD